MSPQTARCLKIDDYIAYRRYSSKAQGVHVGKIIKTTKLAAFASFVTPEENPIKFSFRSKDDMRSIRRADQQEIAAYERAVE